MPGIIADDRKREGYELERSLEAALPMPVWSLDLEIERPRPCSAAELGVLRLCEAGDGELHRLTRLLGLGDDTRLAETVLVKMIGAGAIESIGDRFGITPVGQGWKASGNTLARERLTFEIRLDPTLSSLEWVGEERPVWADKETWTIELPAVGDDELQRRKPEIGRLVREEGLPDEDDKTPREQRAAVDLLAFSVISHRVHWRPVRVDVWRHPIRKNTQLVGYIGEAEHPPLTDLLASHELMASQKRVVAKSKA